MLFRRDVAQHRRARLSGNRGANRRHADADSVLWLDIWQHPDELLAAGLTQAQCLQQLHLFDAQQQLHTGVDAFLMLWQTVPKLRGLAWLSRFAPVRGVLALGYRLFLPSMGG